MSMPSRRAITSAEGSPGWPTGSWRAASWCTRPGSACGTSADRPPDADTVFRIASMTKSFTASAILALRDDGVLKLDDLAEDYVPELRGWPPVSPDSARISIRHLLTMTAGFPTDDPWGDRQQGLPLEEFAQFLAKGVSFNCAPGTRFEYSNLGYAILGRVITAVTGMAYPDYVRHRLLKPAGHDAHRLRGGGIRGPASRPRGPRGSPAATGARRAAGPRWRSTRPARSPRWAGSSAACAISPAGWPASPPRSRPASDDDDASGAAGQPARDAAAAGPHRLGHRA